MLLSTWGPWWALSLALGENNNNNDDNNNNNNNTRFPFVGRGFIIQGEAK
jgi:hypothetical protein